MLQLVLWFPPIVYVLRVPGSRNLGTFVRKHAIEKKGSRIGLWFGDMVRYAYALPCGVLLKSLFMGTILSGWSAIL